MPEWKVGGREEVGRWFGTLLEEIARGPKSRPKFKESVLARGHSAHGLDVDLNGCGRGLLNDAVDGRDCGVRFGSLEVAREGFPDAGPAEVKRSRHAICPKAIFFHPELTDPCLPSQEGFT